MLIFFLCPSLKVLCKFNPFFAKHGHLKCVHKMNVLQKLFKISNKSFLKQLIETPSPTVA